MNRRSYTIANSTVYIVFGDITTSQAQVLVSSDDNYLSMGGGVSATILSAGGNAIALDAAKKVPAALGDVVVTTAGSLDADYIFHAVTIGRRDSASSVEDIVKSTVRKCMRLLDALQLRSIAFPAIGVGVAGFAYDDVAVSMAEVICEELASQSSSIEVTLFLYDGLSRMQPLDFVRFFEEFAARVPLLREVVNNEMDLREVGESIGAGPGDPDEQRRAVRKTNIRKLLRGLEDNRYKLEERLVALMDGGDSSEVRRARQKLKENEELRIRYLNELRAPDPEQPKDALSEKGGLKVFVSSTYIDLVEYRAVAKDEIERRDMHFRGMEHFGADPGSELPADKIISEVRKADAYLGIFGVRYGSIDPATGLSMTELEYRAAEAAGMPMLIYMMHDDALVRVADIESAPESKARLKAFKERIMMKRVIDMFNSPVDLGRKIYGDLGKLEELMRGRSA